MIANLHAKTQLGGAQDLGDTARLAGRGLVDRAAPDSGGGHEGRSAPGRDRGGRMPHRSPRHPHASVTSRALVSSGSLHDGGRGPDVQWRLVGSLSV